VNVSLTVGNTGTDDAPAFDVAFYLSTDETISTSDDVLCTTRRATLVAGTAETFGLACTVPVVDDGMYYVGAIVDPADELPETSETNNSAHYDLGRLTVAN
jgi:subtilase family serine protease